MNRKYPQLSIRFVGSNPDHHLWNNNGTWWIDYTIQPDAIHKGKRVRASLGTKSLAEARVRRDAVFNSFQLQRAA